MGFNAIFTGLGFIKDAITFSKTSLDDLPGDTNFDKYWNLLDPGWSLFKTVVPLQLGTVIKFGTEALMSDYKAPDLNQLFKVLGKEQQLYQNIGDVRLEPASGGDEFVRKVIRKSDGVNLGEYRYNNETGKVEKFAEGDKIIQRVASANYPNTEDGLKDFLVNGDPNTTDAWGQTDFDDYWEKLEEKFDYNGKTYYKIKLKGETDPKTMYEYMYFDNGQFKYN